MGAQTHQNHLPRESPREVARTVGGRVRDARPRTRIDGFCCGCVSKRAPRPWDAALLSACRPDQPTKLLSDDFGAGSRAASPRRQGRARSAPSKLHSSTRPAITGRAMSPSCPQRLSDLDAGFGLRAYLPSGGRVGCGLSMTVDEGARRSLGLACTGPTTQAPNDRPVASRLDHPESVATRRQVDSALLASPRGGAPPCWRRASTAPSRVSSTR